MQSHLNFITASHIIRLSAVCDLFFILYPPLRGARAGSVGQEEGEGAVSGLVGAAGGEGAALDASVGQEEGEGAGASLKRAREGQQEEQLVA